MYIHIYMQARCPARKRGGGQDRKHRPTWGSPFLECIFGHIREILWYSGIQQIQLDTARYVRIQLDTVGYSEIQWIFCKMARYRDTVGYQGYDEIQAGYRCNTGGRGGLGEEAVRLGVGESSTASDVSAWPLHDIALTNILCWMAKQGGGGEPYTAQYWLQNTTGVLCN